MDYSSLSLNALVSPRGTRERLQTKRQQFEAIIQEEKDKNQQILDSLVKPYHKKAKYEDFKQSSQKTYSPRLNYTIQAPSKFRVPVGFVAPSKESGTGLENQHHESMKHTALNDTFIRGEKSLNESSSQPIIKPSNAQSVYYSEDEEGMGENLRYMYPEPGQRDTFVEGVYNQSLVKKMPRQDPIEPNPYYQLGSTYSQRKAGSIAMTRNSYDEANKLANGIPPSYGRIIGLGRRLDKGVSEKLKVDDAQRDLQDSLKDLVNQENERFQYQQKALNVINHR